MEQDRTGVADFGLHQLPGAGYAIAVRGRVKSQRGVRDCTVRRTWLHDARRGSPTPPKPLTEGLQSQTCALIRFLGRPDGRRVCGVGDPRTTNQPARNKPTRAQQANPRTTNQPAHNKPTRAQQANPRATNQPAHGREHNPCGTSASPNTPVSPNTPAVQKRCSRTGNVPSPWTQPRPNLDPTSTQPRPNLDPTSTQPRPNLEPTSQSGTPCVTNA